MSDLRTLGKAMRDALEPFAISDKAIGDEPGPFRFETGTGYRLIDREHLRRATAAIAAFDKALSEPPAAKAGINPYLYDGLLEQLHFRADHLRERPAGHVDNETWRDVAAIMAAAAKAIETLKEPLSEPPAARVCVACGKVWDGETCGQKDNGWPYPVCTPSGASTSHDNNATRLLRQCYVTLAFAFNRLHESSRLRDGELCADFQKVRAQIENHFKNIGVKL